MFEDTKVCARMEDSNFELNELNLWTKVAGVNIPLPIAIVNSIEIHILRKSSNKPFYEKILLSLTICDLIGGVLSCFGVPIDIFVKTEFYNLLYWNLWGFWICYWTITALLHLIVIGLDRLWALVKPFHHRIYNSQRKLVIAVVVSWCIPMIFVIFHIILILSKNMKVKEAYLHIMISMQSDVSKVVVIADMILIVSYCSIIRITFSKKKKMKMSMHSKQTNSIRTLMLCIGTVSVFIICTTPFVVFHLTSWNGPCWLEMLGTFLSPMNQVFNSVLYLVIKYRNRRSRHVVRRNTRCSVVSMESRL